MPDLNSSIFICGDFAPTGRIKADSKFLSDDYKKIISESTLRIVNLECPLTSSDAPIKKSGPPLKASPEYINLLSYAGFNVAALANNHIMDYGSEGLADTLNACEKNKISTVGAGKNINEASEVLIIDADGIKCSIINLCEQEFSIASANSPGANPSDPVSAFYKIKEAREKSDYVLVIFHGGHEYYNLPSLRIKSLFHYFADCGADAVVGHHPHRSGGYEIYNGKPLFYSLGNFLFDERNEPDFWYEGMGLQLKISKQKTLAFELYPFYQCKVEPVIRSLDDNEKKTFLLEIETLNRIIADDKELEKKWTEFAGKFSSNIIKNLMNFNRAERLLYNKNIMKNNLVSEEHLLNILNLTRCESLRDVMIYSVKDNLKIKN